MNAAIITAYNGTLFDFPYLVMRALKIGFNPHKLSPVDHVTFSMEFKENNFKRMGYYSSEEQSKVDNMISKGYKPVKFNVNIEGLYLFDYLEIYKKFSFKIFLLILSTNHQSWIHHLVLTIYGLPKLIEFDKIKSQG